MPNIEFSLSDLQNLLGKRITSEELKEIILFSKGEVETIDVDTVRIDIKDTNRPDLWSVEGVSRELKGKLGIETGLPIMEANKSNVTLKVEKKVEKIRPKIVCAIVKNLALDDFSIKQMIQLQEKICQTFGRNRYDVAIGVYDFDKLVPPVTYTSVKPSEMKFVPLGFSEEMTPKEILERHPTGIEYAHLLSGFSEYPILMDSAKNVLSLPPIINSDHTGKVTEETKNVFVEVTGNNLERISTALNVMVSTLMNRGGDVFSVEVLYEKEKIVTPNFSPCEFTADLKYCKKLLGIDLKDDEILKLLRMARYEPSIKSGKLHVKYPSYRNDVMHQNDIIEDMAIKYDYNKIHPEYPKLATTGHEDRLEVLSSSLRKLMIGLGFQEVLNYILTSSEKQFARMEMKPESHVEIQNPVSSEYNIFRCSIIPSLIETLSNNKHKRFPQNVFEVGDCVLIDSEKETSTDTVRKLAFLISHSGASFSEASSIFNAIKESLGLEFILKPHDNTSFIKGRCAGTYLKNELVGLFGEIHPKVLENWDLEKPIVGFEMNVEKIFEFISANSKA
jgi:phenylalanyl-tRNA synthetase beta chain